MRSNITQDLKKTFSPEFLNRIDEIITFRSLNKADIAQIVEILLEEVTLRLKNLDIEFEFTPESKELLCDVGYDPERGARPLRRAIQKYLEDPLSEKLLRGEVTNSCRLVIGVEGDRLSFSAHPQEGAKV
jgi:ATP-dependent Clp protease ATP-binding subunit ClpC